MEDHDVTFENAQARERTQVLMDIANQTGGLVIGTGDLSELALGWATYNGDHMSMYGVNASIPKTLVRHLVDYVARDNLQKDEDLTHVLEDILDTPVSPELLPAVQGKISQKTEDLVGPYELHDFFLYYIIRWGFGPRKVLRLAEQALGRKYDRAVILKWLKSFYRRFFAQQFKRSCLPDGPKVGSVALSPRGDWRMPSLTQWPSSGWMNWRSCKLSALSRQSRSLSPTITTKQPPQAKCLRRLFDSLPIYSSGGNSQQVWACPPASSPAWPGGPERPHFPERSGSRAAPLPPAPG